MGVKSKVRNFIAKRKGKLRAAGNELRAGFQKGDKAYDGAMIQGATVGIPAGTARREGNKRRNKERLRGIGRAIGTAFSATKGASAGSGKPKPRHGGGSAIKRAGGGIRNMSQAARRAAMTRKARGRHYK